MSNLPAVAVGGPQPVFAETVRESDNSSSILIEPTANDQIHLSPGATHELVTEVYKETELPDGSSKSLFMDIQIPVGEGPFPAVIYVTGGGFLFMQRDKALKSRTYVAEHGFVVASIDYRVIPDGATFPDSTGDVQDAVRYLRENASRFNVAPEHIALWGESAGGYLVALAATRSASDDLGGSVSRVQAVIDKFGPSDLSDIGGDFEEETRAIYRSAGYFPAQFLFGLGTDRSADSDPVTVRRSDPASYVTADSPPFLFMHGLDDRVVSPSQTLRLHEQIRTAGGDSTRYVLAGAGHGEFAASTDPVIIAAWETNKVMNVMVDFLHRTLGQQTATDDTNRTGSTA